MLLCACGVWNYGCSTRRAPARPVVSFVAVVHPMVPQTMATTLDSPPDLELNPLAAPPQIGPSHTQPPKPHVAAPAAQEPAETEKHVQPTIVPEVDTEELKAAQTETQRSLDVAEKNLLMAQGKKLNATQQDLVSKVRGFADNAREAMRSGEWVRAKNLSSKAEVLSEQLAASL
jgi:hypothetical protein